MIARRYLWLMGLAMFLSESRVSLAQEGGLTPEFVLSGFRDSRERLASGAFRATGIKVEDSEFYGKFDGKFEIASAFDYHAGLFRFDRVETNRIFTDRTNWKLGEEGGRFVRTPQRTIHWMLGEKMLAAIHPTKQKAPGYVRPFDIRIAGVISEIGLRHDTPFVDTMKYLTTRKGINLTQIEKSLVRLDWPDDGAKSMLYFDTSSSFLPTRFDIYRELSPGKYADEPLQATTVSWRQINAVWVPKTMTTREGLKPGSVTTYEYNFVWDHVNKPVPPEIFTVEGMSLPEGLPIVSNETGQTVTLGKIGDKEFPPVSIDSSVFGNIPFYLRRWFILTVVGVILALTAGVIWWRRHRKLTASA